MSDPAKYRSKEEVEEVKTQHDPIDHVKRLLAEAGIAEDDLKDIDRDIRAVVLEAAAFAQESPEPPAEELLQHVYS